jgi:tetratricopeptide (TPR) repeat protein
VGLRLECGLAYLEQGDGEAALQHFEKIESAASDRALRIDANRRMGEALLNVGRVADARVRADRILGVSAEEPGGLRLLAACQFAAGEFEAATASYRKLLENSDSPWTESDALLGLGLCLARSGEFAESERRLSRVLEVNPLVGGDAYAAAAYLHARGGSSETALDEARAAVRASPDDPYLHYVLGRLLRVGNDFEEAQKELKTALNQASFSDLYNELGYLGLLDGRASDSVNYLRESLARENREETRILLGHSLIEAGSMIEARRLFEGAMQRKPSAGAQLGLAYCMYRNRQSAAAQELFQRLADSFPDASDEAKGYAAQSLLSIVDVESKVRWQDSIHWRQVGNGWVLTEPYGINPRITSGSFRLMGSQKPATTDNQLTFLERPVALDTFFEFEVDLQPHAGNQGRYGIFLAHIVGGGGRGASQASVRAAIYVAVEADGKIVFKKGHSVQELAEPWRELEGAEKVLPGQALSLGLKRRSQGSNKFQLLVDGIPTGEEVEMDRWRGTNKTTLAAAFFVAADGGRKVDVAMTESRIVKFVQ